MLSTFIGSSCVRRLIRCCLSFHLLRLALIKVEMSRQGTPSSGTRKLQAAAAAVTATTVLSSSQFNNNSITGSESPSTDSLEVSMEKRLEALKAKEARVSKKEKELNLKLGDLDRRAKLIEEAEEKQGTVATREAQCESKEKELQQILREIKRRDKAVKESEEKAAEVENALFSRETFLSSQEKELQAKLQAVDAREKQVFNAQADAENLERKLAERKRVVEAAEAESKSRRETVVEEEQKLDERQKAITLKEGEIAKKDAELAQRDQDLVKANQAVGARAKELQVKETEVAKERERLMRKSHDLSEAEVRIAADTKNISLKKEEIARRVAHVQESEQELRAKTLEFKQMALDTTKQRDLVEKHVLENRRYEHELNNMKNDLKAQEADIRSRERRAAAQQREHFERDQVLNQREETLRGEREEVRQREAACDEREAILTSRESSVASFQKEVEALKERCIAREHATAQRAAALDRKEKDLVEWMKEMEWREMMLGDREAVVDREPVTLPTTTVGSTTTGFSNKAFGHAMVDVQLRRLKDQYISAQMKHARNELRTGKSLLVKHKRLPRAGIVATHSTGDVGDDISKASQIHAARQSVHDLSVQFKLFMSRHRAFDSFEDVASPEKLQHLEVFSPDERTALCMAANMEYMMKVHEDLLTSLLTSPLDEKDKAANVQDLVNRLSRWWRKTGEQVQHNLIQLLSDRERYLSHSITILQSKTAQLPQLNRSRPVTRGRVDNSHVRQSDDSGQPDPPDAADLSPSNTGAAPSGDMKEEQSVSESQQSPRPNDEGKKPGSRKKKEKDYPPYTATTAFDHVKESRILAPRGLATLKAVSEMSQAGERDERDLSPPKPQHHPSSKTSPSGRSLNASAEGQLVQHQTSGDTAPGGRAMTPAGTKRLNPSPERYDYSGPTVSMKPLPPGSPDVELSAMFTGRTRSSKSRRKEEPFDVLKLPISDKPPASPYKAKLTKLTEAHRSPVDRQSRPGSRQASHLSN